MEERELQPSAQPHQASVAVVILNWNGRHYLEQFLPSVISRSQYANLQVIVADNASTDDSGEYLAAQFPDVRVILNKENHGFAGGYNEALKEVQADYFILLNSDVEVSSNWIEPVIELMESDPQIAAAQPKLLDFNKRGQFEYAGAAGGYIDRFGYPFCRGRIFDEVEADHAQYNEVAEIFWGSGAALFVRSSCWKEVQGFDADFFAHMEEIDLCWRLKNRGYKIMYCPASTVYHIGGGTLQSDSPFKSYLNFRNNLTMLLKNLPAERLFAVLFVRMWLDFVSLLKFLTEGKYKHVRSINKAHMYFFRHLFHNFRKRGNIKKRELSGMLESSIVWQFFIRKRRRFKDLQV